MKHDYRYITYTALGKKVAEVCGKDPASVKFVYYNPKAIDAKTTFPFRPINFFTSPSKAKQLLGWKPTHSLTEDLKEWYASYKALGLESAALPAEEIVADVQVRRVVCPRSHHLAL
jgi:nucleoside-diphosphate-sugar epimerase